MIKIETRNLDKYFNKHTKNSIHVINNTNLTFNDQGFVAILGESGSGKTTLLNVLSGIDKANSGEILFDGKELKGKEAENIRNNKFGYVFQNYYMIQDITVYENLYLALAPYHLTSEEIDERIDYVLSSVEMIKYKKRQMNQLSGGQIQRIAIARALVKSPEVIFADEPTGNLDETTTLKIMMILKKISEKCLVIVATHEKRIADFFADRIIKISDGKVVDDFINPKANTRYDAVDDNNLYLQEYESKELKDSEDSIKIYKGKNEKLDFSIIIDHDRYYIKSDNPKKFDIITPESNIQAIDSKRPQIDSEQIENFEYELKKPTKDNDGLISFKYTLSKVLTSIKSKSFYIMIIALILISGITIWGVGDFETIYKDDVKSHLVTDSRTANISIVDTTTISNPAEKSKYYYSVAEKINSLEGVKVFPDIKLFSYFLYEGAYQIEQTVGVDTTAFNNYSYIPLEYLDSSLITYGRYPKNHNEVVVDEWVLDNFMAEENIVSKAITQYESFLGKTFYVKSANVTFTIVGICRTNNVALYALSSDLVNCYRNISVMTYSKLKEDFPGVYDGLEFGDNAVICNETRLNAKGYLPQSVSIYGYSYETVQTALIPKSYPITFAMSDEAFEILCFRMIQNDASMTIISDDKEVVKKFINEFNNNELDASLDNPTHKVIELLYTDKYQTAYDSYMRTRNNKITMRLAITLSIIVMCAITLFITMKAHANENMQSIMVYRLLGLKKRIVIRMYAMEIFITSVFVMIPTSLLVTGVLEFFESLPGSSFEFGLTIPVYLITILSLIILNILIGILPISIIMRKTPAELVSNSDI